MRKVNTILSGMERNARDQLVVVFFRYRSHRIRDDINLNQVQNKEKDVVLHVTCSGPVELLAKGCCTWLKFRWV